MTAEDSGYAYYREVKNRFNQEHSPFDFIFLSRAGFNGMMRFNRRGEWNIPFCKKPNRFLPGIGAVTLTLPSLPVAAGAGAAAGAFAGADRKSVV